jgi:tetratricopeptide (TPR) repeat protein
MDSPRLAAYSVGGFFLLSAVVVVLWARFGLTDVRVAYGLDDADAPVPEGTISLDAVDPRAVADDLFNRVVDAAAVGDTAELWAFLPLAVTAYGEAGPLDADGLFHLTTLLRIGGRGEESLAGARAILDADPDHLLGLGAAAEAAKLAGRPDEAATYYRRILEVYEVQIERPLDEYLGHASFITRVKADADASARLS